MIHELSWKAVIFFSIFVGFTLGLSFWLGRKAKSSEGFFARTDKSHGSSTELPSPVTTCLRPRFLAFAG